MSNKVVALECLTEQTLVKDDSGRKIRVKKGEVFTTDSRTAETYLRVYKKHFALATGENKNSEVDQEGVIALQNRVDELEAEVIEKDEKIEKLEAEVKEVQLEALRSKHVGKELKDIPYNDLRKIASLKGIEFKGTPKGEELIQALQNAETPETDETEVPETPETKKDGE